MAEPATKQRVINGVDQDQFDQTLNLIKADPELAKCRFHLENRWMSGGHSRSRIESFYGARQENDHLAPFELDADEPPLLLGKDQGPNPVEHLLNAVTTCVTGAMVYHAAAKGIEIEELRSRTEGELDLQGFLALDPDVPVGYQSLRMTFMVKADCSDEELQEIVKAGQKYSPVFNTLTQGVGIEVVGERL